MIRGYDFHCHIDLDPDPPELIRRCKEKQIVVLAVTTTPKAWKQNKEWTKDCAFVYPAVGLHPELVSSRHTEVDMLVRFIKESRLIGEVGLDGCPRYRNSYTKQKAIFSKVLVESQSQGGRVLSIHSRRAVNDVLDLIEQYTSPDDVLCILHWFSGSIAQAQRAVELGCYFSVNMAMLRSKHGQSLIKTLPIDRLLTETDAPFMKINGLSHKPMHVTTTVDELAGLFNKFRKKMLTHITDNAQQVFSFAGIQLRGI